METIWKGKQTNKQTSNMCTDDKGKQTNKQIRRGGTCRGMDARGGAELHSMQSLVHNVSEYAEELQRCIGDVSEKCGVQYAGSYSDSHGCEHLWELGFVIFFRFMSKNNARLGIRIIICLWVPKLGCRGGLCVGPLSCLQCDGYPGTRGSWGSDKAM